MLLLAACQTSVDREDAAMDASTGGDASTDAGPEEDAGEDPCTCGCARYTAAPADCTIDWAEALGGGASLRIDELVVLLDGARVPRVPDADSCHASLGGYHATDDVGATTLELCATTCGAISSAKELLLHPSCGQ